MLTIQYFGTEFRGTIVPFLGEKIGKKREGVFLEDDKSGVQNAALVLRISEWEINYD